MNFQKLLFVGKTFKSQGVMNESTSSRSINISHNVNVDEAIL